MKAWVGCGLAIGAAILLRPDGGLLLVAVEAYLAHALGGSWTHKSGQKCPRHRFSGAGLILAVVALATLVPWTVRNLRVFHEFQPLAPRYANEENSFVPRDSIAG